MDKMVESGCAGMLSEETQAQMKNYRARACTPLRALPDEMRKAIDGLFMGGCDTAGFPSRLMPLAPLAHWTRRGRASM